MDVLDQSQMNKVMIVTGGSRGIGAATASLATDRGYAICLTYLHDQEAANRIVDSIEQSGGRAIAVAADVADDWTSEGGCQRRDSGKCCSSRCYLH